MTITIKSIERIEEREPARKRPQETKDFVKLLDRCRAQVKLDPKSFTEIPAPVGICSGGYSCAYVAVTFLRMRADGAMTDTITSALLIAAMMLFFAIGRGACIVVGCYVAGSGRSYPRAIYRPAVDPTLSANL